MIKSNDPATKVGMIYAFAISVLPSCQNPMLANTKSTAKRIKNDVEKTSAFAQSVAVLSISMI